MKIIFLLFVSITSLNLFAVTQSTDLHISVEIKNDLPNILQFYTYLETEPLVYKGKNAFEAITFRGEKAQLSFNSDYSKLIFKLDEQKIILADTDLDITNFKNGDIQTLVFENALDIKLVKASLGEKFKIRKKTCFPGDARCSFSWITITPYQFSFELIGSSGDILCIKRGYNTNASNYGKNSDHYNFGHCLK